MVTHTHNKGEKQQKLRILCKYKCHRPYTNNNSIGAAADGHTEKKKPKLIKDMMVFSLQNVFKQTENIVRGRWVFVLWGREGVNATRGQIEGAGETLCGNVGRRTDDLMSSTAISRPHSENFDEH